MASFREPVGPLPARVYWRRRIIVGVVLLAVLVVIAMIIFRPASDNVQGADTSATDSVQSDTGNSDAVADSSSDSADTADGSSEQGTDADPADGSADTSEGSSDSSGNQSANTCDASQIALTAVADDVVYQKNETPKLRLQITNSSGSDCELNVGTSQQNFVITSGEEIIWASQHCETDPQDSVMSLKANQTLQTDTIEWNRTKSSEAKCNAGPISSIADATYQFHVEVGTFSSEKTRLRILN